MVVNISGTKSIGSENSNIAPSTEASNKKHKYNDGTMLMKIVCANVSDVSFEGNVEGFFYGQTGSIDIRGPNKGLELSGEKIVNKDGKEQVTLRITEKI